jgi:hypothetical protein
LALARQWTKAIAAQISLTAALDAKLINLELAKFVMPVVKNVTRFF